MRNLVVRYEEAAPRYDGPAVRSEGPGGSLGGAYCSLRG